MPMPHNRVNEQFRLHITYPVKRLRFIISAVLALVFFSSYADEPSLIRSGVELKKGSSSDRRKMLRCKEIPLYTSTIMLNPPVEGLVAIKIGPTGNEYGIGVLRLAYVAENGDMTIPMGATAGDFRLIKNYREITSDKGEFFKGEQYKIDNKKGHSSCEIIFCDDKSTVVIIKNRYFKAFVGQELYKTLKDKLDLYAANGFFD